MEEPITLKYVSLKTSLITIFVLQPFFQVVCILYLWRLGLGWSYFNNKRAQGALGRSPEEKVKGHSGANNREPQGHNLNNFGRESLDDSIYQI